MKAKYENLDGIRTFSSIGILCMHVLILGQFPECAVGEMVYRLIAGMGVLVQLFFMLSGLVMCCGYYEQFKSGKIDLNQFYFRRYKKIWPFFATLVCIDVLNGIAFGSGITKTVIYEAFANLTLLFGFVPGRDFQVIGIGWTLGVIFGFYCLFPFFVFTLWTKKKAWFTLAVTLILSVLCKKVLSNNLPASHIFIQWMCYFVVGGIIYLYRNNILRFNQCYKWVRWVFIAVGLYLTLCLDSAWGILLATVKNLFGFALVLIGAISDRNVVLSNKFVDRVSDISLELYLSHVFIFRVIQKLGILNMIQHPTISYVVAVLLTFACSVGFTMAFRGCGLALSKIINHILQKDSKVL